MEVTGNKPGDKATYTCDYGFELSGNSQRVCQASGEWSGSDPTCERKSVCGDIYVSRQNAHAWGNSVACWP